jgi:uncharacterized membrane protein YfcA
MMTRTLTTLVAVATISVSAIAAPTAADARWRHHHHGFPVAPIVGGLAAGALIGAAVAARPYYEPVYFEPACYVRRERIWDGWRWRIRRVEDCY